MHRLAVLALVCLTGCAQSDGGGAVAFRAVGAPIYSAAVFDASRLAGKWAQVAGFASGPQGCAGGVAEFVAGPSGLEVNARLCLNGRETRVAGKLVAAGPGRFAVAGMADWWVLWVDSGYRTLAIGTPSGGFGFVLDRAGITPDRLRAAAEVFDFNGYAVGALTAF